MESMNMKTMIVYFSLEGNTDYAAKEIAEKLGADLLRLELARPFPKNKLLQFLVGGKGAMLEETPGLEALCI